MRYNGNRFSVYESEEKTVLGLLDELGSHVNHNTDNLKNKTDLYGDHKGSWQGLSKPTLSEEGMRATVEKNSDDIKEISSQLDNKANLNSVFSMANMGQDIKEAMTGGSVAVIGKNAVLTENIVNGQVTPIKTSFIEATNIINLMVEPTYKNGKVLNNAGWTEDNINFFTITKEINVTPNKSYVFSLNYKDYIPSKIVFKNEKGISTGIGGVVKVIDNPTNPVVAPANSLYMYVSYYKSGGWTDEEINGVINKIVVEESEVITPFTPNKLKDVIVPYLDEEVENLKNTLIKTKENIIDLSEIKENCVLNGAGWTEDNTNYFTSKIAIEVEEGQYYSFGYDDFPIKAYEIVFKTEKSISVGIGGLISRVFSTARVKAPAGAKYMFITFDNKFKEDLSKIKVCKSISIVDVCYNTPLKNSTIMTLGDSYTEGDLWQCYIAGKFGIKEIKNLGVGGSKVNVFADNVNSENIADVDFVFVMGYVNSWESADGTVDDSPSNSLTATLASNYKYIVEKILNLKPTIKIVIITPHKSKSHNGQNAENKTNVLKNVAKYYSLPCIDVYNEGGFNSLTYDIYLKDLVHSSEFKNGGYHKEGEYIAGQLIKYFG